MRPVSGIDLDRYTRQLIDRFSNPELADTVARLCTNTLKLIPTFLLPVIRSQLAAGGPIARATAVITCWARYAEGTDEAGGQITIVDERAAQLHAAASRQREEPLAFLQDNRDIFRELVDDRASPSYSGGYSAPSTSTAFALRCLNSTGNEVPQSHERRGSTCS